MRIENKSSFFLAIILAVVSFSFFAAGLFSPRDLWVQDEARYGEVVREMIAEGRLIVPHLNGYYYPDKPPVYFWIVALFSIISGHLSSFVFRLVSFLSALGCVILIYYMGKYLFDSFCGFISALILTSSLLFVLASGFARMDVLLTLFVMLAIFSFYAAYQDKRNPGYVAFYIFVILALSIKGPLGIIFPFVTVTFFLIHKRKLKEIKRLLLDRGLILAFVLVSVWLSLVIVKGEFAYLKDILSKQIIGRTFNSWSHKEPFYFYLVLFPLAFLPWSVFLPRTLFCHSLKKEPMSLLLIWFLSGFIVISIISGKLFIYLLPLIPPAALIVGKFFGDILQDRMRVSLRIEGYVCSVFLLLIGIALHIASNHHFPQETNVFLPLTFAFGTVFILNIFLGRKPKNLLAIYLFAMLFLSSFMFGHVAPRLDKYYSPREMSEKIVQLSSDGFEATTFNTPRGIFNFYSNMYIKELSLQELQSRLESDNNVLCIIEDRDFKKIKDKLYSEVTLIKACKLEDRKYCLITNRQPD